MKKYFRILCVIFLLLLGAKTSLYAQKTLENQMSDSLTAIANSFVWVGKVKVLDFRVNSDTKSLTVVTNDRLGYIPLRIENVRRIYTALSKITAPKFPEYKIKCQVDNMNIENMIPVFFNTDSVDSYKQFKTNSTTSSLVYNNSRPFSIENGLINRHIALWASHGWYFNQKRSRWEWQRPRVFQTVEDLYTLSYVLPFLVPMLENAGANVLLPRERDIQTNEVIVDNDNKKSDSRYTEHNERNEWSQGLGFGFANPGLTYIQGDNPFRMGTYRTAQTVSQLYESSFVVWNPSFDQTGKYAVYVSYQSLPNSATDAHYTVCHKGGKTEFTVNQSISGGTWVYLGHFDFEKGRSANGQVILENYSSSVDKVITADAVKFGGGIGNIARSPISFNTTAPFSDIDSTYSIPTLPSIRNYSTLFDSETSRYPRFAEGARYWLQWAGMPDSIYSKNAGTNDYIDDLQSRALWVNYLAGGSSILPLEKGLGIPIDLALALHSDAGTTGNDSVIGTLGIYSLRNSNGSSIFKNGISRSSSRDLTDLILSQVINDTRSLYFPKWTRRGLWDKSYNESRVPEVPSGLIEILSHQNFADMRYGLDPRFRFDFSRAVYKGILRYLAAANGIDYTVQPLAVNSFSCKFTTKNMLELHWLPTNDSIEATAKTDKYVIYTRINNGGFDNGVLVTSNKYATELKAGDIYSFKITAVNKGGESFPSEILSASWVPDSQGEVLVVNAFDRISAPESFVSTNNTAGFLNDKDAGVPYLWDISYVGSQFQFKRDKGWNDNDAPGFGACYTNYETKKIAGNTFDYPYIHGEAIKNAGFSFVSCSHTALSKGFIDMTSYKIVDIILGKQKQTFIGNGKKAPEFKTFPLALQQSIRLYCEKGGNLLLSGAYIGSDICESNTVDIADKQFLESILKTKFVTSRASVGGGVKIVSPTVKTFKKQEFIYATQPNAITYRVESADAIVPIGKDAFTIARYTENNYSAATAYAGNYKTCTFGFPFEAIETEKDRFKLMEAILAFFTAKSKKISN